MCTLQVSMLIYSSCPPLIDNTRSFQPSFEAVARAWNKVPTVEKNKHFFAVADFDQAMAVFQRVRRTYPLLDALF